MKSYLLAVVLLLVILFLSGCETVHQTTYDAGEAVGKGARAIGGITEGAAQGYRGTETSDENPYGR